MKFLIAPLLATAILVCLASCLVLNNADSIAPLRALAGHEKTAVSLPATVGAVLGGVAGVPLALLALPVTLPTAIALSDGDMMMLLPLVPMVITAEVGAIMIGGPAWLIFGWW